jgi:hypothetical protein
MKEGGKRANFMAKASRHCLMELFLMEIGKMVVQSDKDSAAIQMERNTQVPG